MLLSVAHALCAKPHSLSHSEKVIKSLPRWLWQRATATGFATDAEYIAPLSCCHTAGRLTKTWITKADYSWKNSAMMGPSIFEIKGLPKAWLYQRPEGPLQRRALDPTILSCSFAHPSHWSSFAHPSHSKSISEFHSTKRNTQCCGFFICGFFIFGRLKSLSLSRPHFEGQSMSPQQGPTCFARHHWLIYLETVWHRVAVPLKTEPSQRQNKVCFHINRYSWRWNWLSPNIKLASLKWSPS